ncbi:hypothetical protein BK669_13555 [Pseudomonas fluorescens]|nr:hypothetical protein BK669_13555 [Pseudomonas fluorescens]
MGSVLASNGSRWRKATPAPARAKINTLNSGYQKIHRSVAYLRKLYKYQLRFFYGITNSLYKSLHALATVAPATVAQPTVIQQSHLKLTQQIITITLNAP